MSLDWKCGMTTAILSVLIYLLLVNLLTRVWGNDVGKEMNDALSGWYKSMEVVMLASVFIAFNLNNRLYTSCKPM